MALQVLQERHGVPQDGLTLFFPNQAGWGCRGQILQLYPPSPATHTYIRTHSQPHSQTVDFPGKVEWMLYSLGTVPPQNFKGRLIVYLGVALFFILAILIGA